MKQVRAILIRSEWRRLTERYGTNWPGIRYEWPLPPEPAEFDPEPVVFSQAPKLVFERIYAVVNGQLPYRMIHCEGLILHAEPVFEDDA